MANVTMDFYAMAVVVALTLLTMIVEGFLINNLVGVIMLVCGSLAAALTLWNQYCVRSGNCTALAWLLVVFMLVILTFSLLFMVAVIKARRRGEPNKIIIG
jgi:hypothetical protein